LVVVFLKKVSLVVVKDEVEDRLGRMRLSEAEKKSVRIGPGGGSRACEGLKVEQAVVKVLSEKRIPGFAIEQALGRVWCPLKGIDSKDLGENHFLITFHQASGKRRALEDGPWMVGRDLRDLVIVADYDASKTLQEMEFNSIPIWVRVLKLPLGFIDKEVGRVIGAEIGKVLDVDLGDNIADAGCFVRVKVRIDIRKPLMRGVSVFDEVKAVDRWCPLQYEFLPDFCYVCGVIGHVDKVFDKKMEGEMSKQFDRSLRLIPERRKGSVEMGSFETGGRRQLAWNSSGGGRTRFVGGEQGFLGSKGSDGSSWRKPSPDEQGSKEMTSSKEKEGVQSPMEKTDASLALTGKTKKALDFGPSKDKGVVAGGGSTQESLVDVQVLDDENLTLKLMAKQNRGSKRKYKKLPRKDDRVSFQQSSSEVTKKRGASGI
jgi:hypothetical protein